MRLRISDLRPISTPRSLSTLPCGVPVRTMVIPLTLLLVWSASCATSSPPALRSLDLDPAQLNPWFGSIATTDGRTLSREELLAESWNAYRGRFIQADGRVIDWEAGGRTVSEGKPMPCCGRCWRMTPIPLSAPSPGPKITCGDPVWPIIPTIPTAPITSGPGNGAEPAMAPGVF